MTTESSIKSVIPDALIEEYHAKGCLLWEALQVPIHHSPEEIHLLQVDYYKVLQELNSHKSEYLVEKLPDTEAIESWIKIAEVSSVVPSDYTTKYVTEPLFPGAEKMFPDLPGNTAEVTRLNIIFDEGTGIVLGDTLLIQKYSGFTVSRYCDFIITKFNITEAWKCEIVGIIQYDKTLGTRFMGYLAMLNTDWYVSPPLP